MLIGFSESFYFHDKVVLPQCLHGAVAATLWHGGDNMLRMGKQEDEQSRSLMNQHL